MEFSLLCKWFTTHGVPSRNSGIAAHPGQWRFSGSNGGAIISGRQMGTGRPDIWVMTWNLQIRSDDDGYGSKWFPFFLNSINSGYVKIWMNYHKQNTITCPKQKKIPVHSEKTSHRTTVVTLRYLHPGFGDPPFLNTFGHFSPPCQVGTSMFQPMERHGLRRQHHHTPWQMWTPCSLGAHWKHVHQKVTRTRFFLNCAYMSIRIHYIVYIYIDIKCTNKVHFMHLMFHFEI